jgi:hypothetical protein
MPALEIPGFGLNLPDGPSVLASLRVLGALEVDGAFSFQAPVFSAANIAADLVIPAGFNALSAGPVTINEGVTVTIADHSTWSIV